jgi:MbtH protein
MTTNPFEDDEAAYVVLENNEGQFSLWPTFVDVPAGWTVVFHGERKADCVEYIESTWTDMRPKSLIDAMDQRAAR